MQTLTATANRISNTIKIQAAAPVDAPTFSRLRAAGFAWRADARAFLAQWTSGAFDAAAAMAGRVAIEPRAWIHHGAHVGKYPRLELFINTGAPGGQHAGIVYGGGAHCNAAAFRPAAMPESEAPPPAPPAVPAWFTVLPAAGLAITAAESADYRTIPAALAGAAYDALTADQLHGGGAFYAHFMPAAGNLNGVVRLLPEDQNPPAPWRLLDPAAIRPAMATRAAIIARLSGQLQRAPIIGDAKAAAPESAQASGEEKSAQASGEEKSAQASGEEKSVQPSGEEKSVHPSGEEKSVQHSGEEKSEADAAPVVAVCSIWGDVIELPDVFGGRVRVARRQLQSTRAVLATYTKAGAIKPGRGINRDNLLIGGAVLDPGAAQEAAMRAAGWTVARYPRSWEQRQALVGRGFQPYLDTARGYEIDVLGLVWAKRTQAIEPVQASGEENPAQASGEEKSAGAQDSWKPEYSRWRHGGWYVHNVRYPSGACGCVSNKYPDKKWRIACDARRVGGLGEPGDFTYASRDAAALAEREIAAAENIAAIADPTPAAASQAAADMARFIAVAADSIGELRRLDVYRVLVESNRGQHRAAIAAYIKRERPDLADEVNDVLDVAAADEARAAIIEADRVARLQVAALETGDVLQIAGRWWVKTALGATSFSAEQSAREAAEFLKRDAAAKRAPGGEYRAPDWLAELEQAAYSTPTVDSLEAYCSALEMELEDIGDARAENETLNETIAGLEERLADAEADHALTVAALEARIAELQAAADQQAWPRLAWSSGEQKSV